MKQFNPGAHLYQFTYTSAWGSTRIFSYDVPELKAGGGSGYPFPVTISQPKKEYDGDNGQLKAYVKDTKGETIYEYTFPYPGGKWPKKIAVPTTSAESSVSVISEAEAVDPVAEVRAMDSVFLRGPRQLARCFRFRPRLRSSPLSRNLKLRMIANRFPENV